MNPPQYIYPALEKFPWLSAVGSAVLPDLGFPVTYVKTAEAAMEGFRSTTWADIKTAAQGDLTGYLAKHHYEAYGTHWNKLAKQSRALVESAARAKLEVALKSSGFPTEMLQQILPDINRAAIEIAYRERFPKSPKFFENLLQLYEAGRLPCGWQGDRCLWPKGNLIAF
jgi:hypothetical protein